MHKLSLWLTRREQGLILFVLALLLLGGIVRAVRNEVEAKGQTGNPGNETQASQPQEDLK